MQKLISKHFMLFLLMIVLVALGSIIFILFEKGEINLVLNRHRTHFLDFFFRYITDLGTGWTFVAATLICVLIRFRFAILFAGSGLLTLVISALLKNVLFPDAIRPAKYFEGKATLNFIEGVETLYHNSFPSGHTITAFAFFTMLAFIIGNKTVSAGCFLIAALVGLSRIYLLKHFFADVYAGAIIGFAISMLVYHYLTSLNYQWMEKRLSFQKKNATIR